MCHILTYLRHLSTYLQPRDPHGAVTAAINTTTLIWDLTETSHTAVKHATTRLLQLSVQYLG